MDTTFAEAELSISLGAIATNYAYLRSQSTRAQCGAVVKANAYGLGVAQVAPVLQQAGCEHFFVAHLGEGVELRKLLGAGPQIVVFHGVRAGQEQHFTQHNLIPCLNDMQQIALWQNHAHAVQKKLPAILHADTGINRLGLDPDTLEQAYQENPNLLEGIELRYLMSHLSCIGTPEHPLNTEQLKRFNHVRRLFPNTPCTLANSGGVLVKDCYHFDLLRPGCSLYGVNSVPSTSPALKPVITLRAPIMHLRQMQQAGPVGYGATAEVPAGTWLATVPVGYADGYFRSLSNKTKAMLVGVEVPLVGRVSMDMTVFDVTRVPEEKRHTGAVLELINAEITVDKVADWAGTIGYEILTDLGHRYKRHYIA